MVRGTPAELSASSQAMATEMEVDVVAPEQTIDNGLKGYLESVAGDIANQASNLTKNVPRFRKVLTKETLLECLQQYDPSCQSLIGVLNGSRPATIKGDNEIVDAFFGLLIQVYLLDSKELETGFALSEALVVFLKVRNSRRLDSIASRIYFYFANFAEMLGRAQEIRPKLLQCQRTATLRHDNLSLATLLTLLLRNHLLVNDITGADKLLAKTSFPTTAPNAVIARYLYYMARVRAIQLDYSSASDCLTNAIRKVDANEYTAGFLQSAYKMNIIVQLLIGEIPEKEDLKRLYLEESLTPYSYLVNAVRQGDLNEFGNVVDQFRAQFSKDGTLSLISRLRNNVLKTGIRSISLSYSRISLKDICHKLGLQSEESAEYIISKAIHENIIAATLNHEAGELLSSVPADIYSSDVPQKGFHERIKFCLELRNESVRAMRYPEDTGRKAISEVEEQRMRMDESLIGDHDDVEDI